MNIPSDKRKHDYKNGDYQNWLTKVESVKLYKIKPEKVQAMKIRYIRENGTDPEKIKKAKISVNSIIRNAKALFSKKALKFVTSELPERLPFHEIEFEKPGKNRYKSEIRPELLMTAAKAGLSKDQPELYKIFILALGAGLRRTEIDTLTWGQLNFERSTVRVETNAYTEIKSFESEEDVDVDSELLATLRNYKIYRKSIFVINSRVKPRQSITYHHYRCESHFFKLTEWLRSKGITAKNAIHSLRIELGSIICQQWGIYAASAQLRHADIRITRDTYLDKKDRVVVNIGSLSKEPVLKVVSE